MSEPNIAARQPAVLDLQPGTYYWCTCGKSASQPFCDGSHQGSAFAPQELVLEEARKVALCQCKHSKTGAFCDGTHKGL